MDATVGLYITYYNECELLTELIQSIAPDLDWLKEIIVYDDCSSFPAQDFVPTNASIKIIPGAENRGEGFGRNRLLEQAGADYVHFHDTDDFFLPGWLSRVRQAIKDHNNPEAVFTEAAKFINGEMQAWRLGLEKLEVGGDLLGFCLENGMVVGAGTFSRKLLQKMDGYPETLSQPVTAFHIRLAAHCSSYAVVTEPLVGIRIRNDSHSHTLRKHNRLQIYRDGLRALKLVAPDVPGKYHVQLADAAIDYSRLLYQLGDLEGAREGFSWGINLAQPSYRHQPRGYRLCAKVIGPFYAEMVSTIYRKAPKRIREAVR